MDQGEANRPDRIAEGALPNPGPDMWYDRPASPLAPNGACQSGTSGRNILDGPDLLEANSPAMRRVRVRERATLQIRAEAFNVLNHTNFNLPNQNVNSCAGGTVTNTGAARLVQFGLRCQFQSGAAGASA